MRQPGANSRRAVSPFGVKSRYFSLAFSKKRENNQKVFVFLLKALDIIEKTW
jgi:hypothetical protein